MSSSKKLLKNAARYIDIKKLFPRSQIDCRKNPTPYQAKKIKNALAEVGMYGAEKWGQFVPMSTGRSRYMRDAGLPPWLKGIFLSGGEAVTKNLKYVNHEVYYERGGAPRSWQELDTWGDEGDLLKSADKILKKRARRTAAITANGFVISSAQNLRSNELIKKEASYIFSKYAEMSDNGELRGGSGKYKNTKAAHPSEWGMGILFEKGKSPIEKEKARKKYSTAWKSKNRTRGE